jgi:4'-phosphopantetheinyl transferase
VVELVRVALDDGADESDHALLPADERWRAAEIIVPQVRRRFIAGRAALRRVLARRLGVSPSTVAFEYGPHGKPMVAGHPELHFNLSHSGDTALVAVTALAEVGIDYERLRDRPRLPDVAQRFFAPDEFERVADAAPEAREAIFLRYWTRKEAVLKATGRGMGVDTRAIDVGLDTCRATLRVDFDARELALCDLDPDDGGFAALCLAFPAGAARPFAVHWIEPAGALRAAVA